MNVNKSGNIAKGPRPKAPKPKIPWRRGLEVIALRSITTENIINPIVNSDFVFIYIPMYVNNKTTRSVAFAVEITVLNV